MKRTQISIELLAVVGIIALAAWLLLFRPIPGLGINAGVLSPGVPTPGPSEVHYADHIAVLTYHNLDPVEGPGTISPDRFTEQIAFLQDHDYNFISLQQLQEFMRGGTVPPNAVLITFDDGYRSVYRYAFPYLQGRHLPAAVFLIVSKIGQSTNQIPKLSWEEITTMEASGIAFGSHTYDSHREITGPDGKTGPALTTRQYQPSLGRYETEHEYQGRIQKDLVQARTTIENHLGTGLDSLCLPYGLTSSSVQTEAVTAGYHFIFTVNEGLVQRQSDPLALKRINAGQIGMNGEGLHLKIVSLLK